MPTLAGRWGMVEYGPDDIIVFPHGIIGFPEVKQYLLTPFAGTPFSALQAVDPPGLAFILVERGLFGEAYPVKGSDERHDSAIYCIVTVRDPDDPASITANLRAPVFIDRRRRRGEQIIQDEPYPVRCPLPRPEGGPATQTTGACAARTG